MSCLRLFALAFLPLYLASCQADSAPAAAPEERTSEATDFKANPQAVEKREVRTLPLGSPAPEFELYNVDGEVRTLADYADAKVLTLIFTANHCPTAQAYEQRIKEYAKDYATKGVEVVAISPNSPLGLLYNELGYSDLGDEYVDMQVRHEKAAFNFDYLYDGDDHEASLQYGPVATPHVFVFDEARKLRYVGRLDETELPGTANAEDLRAATDDLLAGREVSNPATKTFGCSTKWAWKTAYKAQDQAEWEAKDVQLEQVDLPGLKRLMKNDGDKLRLINVWATWCGPCVAEYPEFLVLQRMYGHRDFEFISLSADKPEQGEKVEKFLDKVHSPIKNLHFQGDNKYDLIEAIDPDWNGALPYTIMVEPGGKVVYQHQAEVDFLDLRQAIVEHPMMGRFF